MDQDQVSLEVASNGKENIIWEGLVHSVKQGAKMSTEFFKSYVGIGLSEQCLEGRNFTAFSTAFSMTCLNADRENREDEGTTGWTMFVKSGVLTRWSRMWSFCSIKQWLSLSARSSHGIPFAISFPLSLFLCINSFKTQKRAFWSFLHSITLVW